MISFPRINFAFRTKNSSLHVSVMNHEGGTISHPRHQLYASVYCVELQRRALYWDWNRNNWPRPHLDVSKENVTYEHPAPKTVKAFGCLWHVRVESQTRAPSPPKSHEHAAQKNGHGAGPQSHLSISLNNSHFPQKQQRMLGDSARL